MQSWCCTGLSVHMQTPLNHTRLAAIPYKHLQLNLKAGMHPQRKLQSKRQSKGKADVVLALVYANNPESYEIANQNFGLSQNQEGEAISNKALGDISFAVNLRHA